MKDIPLPKKHWKVLKRIKSQLQKTNIVWAVTGSTAFALGILTNFEPYYLQQ